MLDQWADYKELFELRKALAKLPNNAQVELSCSCEAEAEWYSRMLTPEERKKIAKFTWDQIT